MIAWTLRVQEESPGSIERRQSLTATGGDPRESATETIPPLSFDIGKGERSGVRAHSPLRRRKGEVNPVGCKEVVHIGAVRSYYR